MKNPRIVQHPLNIQVAKHIFQKPIIIGSQWVFEESGDYLIDTELLLMEDIDNKKIQEYDDNPNKEMIPWYERPRRKPWIEPIPDYIEDSNAFLSLIQELKKRDIDIDITKQSDSQWRFLISGKKKDKKITGYGYSHSLQEATCIAVHDFYTKFEYE